MILVRCKEETYRYNAFHMLKAFFPYAEVASELSPDQEELISVSKDEAQIAVVKCADSKNDAERQLYRQLASLTGEELPWGILMGVRPTKPAINALKKGVLKEDFIRNFQTEKLVSAKKAELAWQIAYRENTIVRKIGEVIGRPVSETWSLYVGIPFCQSICAYCSFSAGTVSDWAGHVDRYLDALEREAEIISGEHKDSPVSVYIGGGTPTSLNGPQLERLFGILKRSFHPETTFEYTLEAGRPDSITSEKLRLAKEYGVTRISINPQSMQQKTLDLVGRGHTVEQIYDAFELARDLGFDNINMDLIAGLPGEGCSEMDDTLSQVRIVRPDSLTVHALAIKRTSAMAAQCTDGRTVADMISMAQQAAFAMNLQPYYLYRQKSIAGNLENVGYAKEGCEGIYNILMMEELQSIIGIGAGTKTKLLLPEPVPDPKRGGNHLTNILHSSDPKAPDAYIRKYLG